MRFVAIMLAVFYLTLCAQDIPLSEHPRPDFERPEWLNLNGEWDFQFDAENVGLQHNWQADDKKISKKIIVPFPWGSKLSGIEDKAVIGWYRREIALPQKWKNENVYLIIGAADWHTTAWLDGQKVGEHKGGYTPFEFDLTPFLKKGEKQSLVIRVDDTEHKFKLYGKQGYGDARGIWQTVYLEARPQVHIKKMHFTPDIDNAQVLLNLELNDKAPKHTEFKLYFKSGKAQVFQGKIKRGKTSVAAEINIENAKLWSLDDPFLYEVDAVLQTPSGRDQVSTYFGMRKISIERLPGTDFPYVALNGKPVYLQLALDQAYHPDGFYTYPSDEFMRDEILRSRRIGLNGQRVHVKIEIPRKLYWADKLGMLIMADVPNSWGEPNENMRAEAEYAMRQMIERDYNHPSIFSWIIFNETWGLFHHTEDGKREYRKETQEWVADMYHLAKKLDPTRLVEDNSPCNEDHTISDLNTWHSYRPGYDWAAFLDMVCDSTFIGSQWNYASGWKQTDVPMLNSEFGNVWGYKGSTGDVDWSYDYHRSMNEFRRHPEIAGWLYTEHHDVINEWNGYYKFDRTMKFDGMDELANGMSLRDLHSVYYLSTGQDITKTVKQGETVDVPLFASFFTDECSSKNLFVETELYGWDHFAEKHVYSKASKEIPFEPWMQKELIPLKVKMPDNPGLAVLSILLKDEWGSILHRNFVAFDIQGDAPENAIVFAPDSFVKQQWSARQWNVLDGLKVNGAGNGFFEFEVPVPAHVDLTVLNGAVLKVELSAKELFAKDRGAEVGGDYMRGGGTFENSANKNSYPMTDEYLFPSQVKILVNGESIGIFDLPDDPADHRGILSWHSQPENRELREAGSYGYLITAPIPKHVLEQAVDGKIKVRFQVDESLSGGLAIYGKSFGRYPIDPTIYFQ